MFNSYERYIFNTFVLYYVPLGLQSFKIGIVIGKENTIYCGLFCFGLDLDRG